MKPCKLTMQAFGSFGAQTVIDFSKLKQNLFLVTGDTGAGKTTIFDAIVYALYGESGSSLNKKDGMELQSQFAGLDLEPFVELVFSEKGQEYVIRRSPRSLRKKIKGEGTREKGPSVTLTMPDGSDYPQKEIKSKIEEIIGLTKSQFMQVAMIAQGEFMELLRASSDEKKKIFRQLFNTGIYQGLVDELDRRQKQLEKETEKIRNICQTEVGHTIIPEKYDGAVHFHLKKESIMSSEHLSSDDMEAFMECLQDALSFVEKALKKAEEEARAAKNAQQAKRDLFVAAKDLSKRFEEYEAAGHEVKALEEQKSAMKEQEKKIRSISDAYEILSEYKQFSGAKELMDQTEELLLAEEKRYPEIEAELQKALDAAAKMEKVKEQEVLTHSQVKNETDQALKHFDSLALVEKKLSSLGTDVENARRNVNNLLVKKETLAENQKEWAEAVESLKDAELLAVKYDEKEKTFKKLREEYLEAADKSDDLNRQKELVTDAEEEYKKCRTAFEQIDEKARRVRSLYFDEQAGLLAKNLKEKEPCPVCGSTHHPNVRTVSEEHAHINRDLVDELENKRNEASKAQETASANAKSAKKLCDEKMRSFELALKKLLLHIAEEVETSELVSLLQAKEALSAYRDVLSKEKTVCAKRLKEWKLLCEKIADASSKEKEIQEDAEKWKKHLHEAELALESARAEEMQIKKLLVFTTKEQALTKEAEARERKEKAIKENQLLKEEAENQGRRLAKSKALIEKCRKDLPGFRETMQMLQAAYQGKMSEKQMEEARWREVVSRYQKSDALELQKARDAFWQRVSAAEALLTAAKEVISGKEKPDLIAMEAEALEKEQEAEEKETLFNDLKNVQKVDRQVKNALQPHLEEQTKYMKKLTCVRGLLRRIAGKVTGGRMDLETFVQRYYLERVLVMANKRFSEMSAGQFALRLCSLDYAGAGKNKGLDLMVYSTVTGKEREIRTLSGGESFMAALSLALGMADQIQTSSAAIELDMLFIDEGFGSLDEHARNQAVKVLRKMAGGRRMIGIISHVTELKQEIDQQLIINKDDKGSHHRWQLN